MDFLHAPAGKYETCFDISLLCPCERADNTVFVTALPETVVARNRLGSRSQEHPFRKWRTDSLPRQTYGTVHEDKIFRIIRTEIDFLQFIGTVRFDAGSKTAAHLNAIGAETQHFRYVFAMENAAGTDDRNIYGSAYFRHNEPAGTVRSQMPACFCAFYDDSGSTEVLGYFS